MRELKLLKPVEFDGQKYEKINLDLEGLTGQDMLIVERQFTSISESHQAVMLKEFSKEYQIMVAARAAKLPVEFFQHVGAKDFSRITILVQNFFIDEGSAEAE